MKSKYDRHSIISLPKETLRKRSKRISVITDETLQLVKDMLAATLDWEKSRPHEVAVALAAVQIDRLERIVIMREDFEDKENHNFIVLINPEIVKTEGTMVTDSEGCLSVKDIYGEVPRYSKIRLRAVSIDGKEIRQKINDPFISRILQHEIDHLNGICFVDHITHQKKAFSILNKKGDLVPIEYKKVVEMGILKSE